MLYYILITTIADFFIKMGLLKAGNIFVLAIPICILSMYFVFLIIGIKLCQIKVKKYKIIGYIVLAIVSILFIDIGCLIFCVRF